MVKLNERYDNRLRLIVRIIVNLDTLTFQCRYAR
jgi:hypothetical protein